MILQYRAAGRRKRFAWFAGILLFLASAAPVAAQSHDAFLTEWYAKLEAVDVEALDRLIAPDAVFELQDFGSKQTKDEFVAYMRKHRDALASADIRYKVQSSAADRVSVLACYDFKGSPVLNRETYTIADGRITGATQARHADSCEGL